MPDQILIVPQLPKKQEQAFGKLCFRKSKSKTKIFVTFWTFLELLRCLGSHAGVIIVCIEFASLLCIELAMASAI